MILENVTIASQTLGPPPPHLREESRSAGVSCNILRRRARLSQLCFLLVAAASVATAAATKAQLAGSSAADVPRVTHRRGRPRVSFVFFLSIQFAGQVTSLFQPFLLHVLNN